MNTSVVSFLEGLETEQAVKTCIMSLIDKNANHSIVTGVQKK